MANVVVFAPDSPEPLLENIVDSLDGHNFLGHTVVDRANNLKSSFDILSQMATKEVAVEYVVTTGRLPFGRNGYPVFSYTPPETRANVQAAKRRWFGRNDRTIEIFPNDFRPPHQDARTVVGIIERCGINARVVGISSESQLADWEDVGVAFAIADTMLRTLSLEIERDHYNLGRPTSMQIIMDWQHERDGAW